MRQVPGEDERRADQPSARVVRSVNGWTVVLERLHDGEDCSATTVVKASAQGEWTTFAPSELRRATIAGARITRLADRSRERSERLGKVGGERGIRTHGTVPGSVVFKTTAFNHSTIFPN